MPGSFHALMDSAEPTFLNPQGSVMEQWPQVYPFLLIYSLFIFLKLQQCVQILLQAWQNKINTISFSVNNYRALSFRYPQTESIFTGLGSNPPPSCCEAMELTMVGASGNSIFGPKTSQLRHFASAENTHSSHIGPFQFVAVQFLF